jgi:hypothetical protein
MNEYSFSLSANPVGYYSFAGNVFIYVTRAPNWLQKQCLNIFLGWTYHKING